MSSIATFYSFKGGVGRSMTLANVAVLLARRGLRVLAVDWDLEAPGLERYFEYFEMRPAPGGLLPLLLEASVDPEAVEPGAYLSHVWEVDVKAQQPLYLLPSGRKEHVSYAQKLEKLDWHDFFERGGGEYLEKVRNKWRNDFDIVLIDSRTGLSDSGGICTILMPDILVAMFTPNQQSMFGVRDVIDAVQASRQRLAYDRMQLTVLPLPCRVSTNSEMMLSQRWLDEFAEVFGRHLQDWVPKGISPRSVFERLRIPQVDWFGFGERLAVEEQGVGDPSSIGYVCDRIAELLASQFANVEHVLGLQAREPPPPHPRPRAHAPSGDGYLYDVYVSSAGGGISREWTSQCVRGLVEWSELDEGEPLEVFFDLTSILPVDARPDILEKALLRSKVLLAILTPAYFTSDYCKHEWAVFEKKERQLGISPLIVPVMLRGGFDFPEAVRERMWIDASKTLTPRWNQNSAETSRLLDSIWMTLRKMIRSVPPLDESMTLTVDQKDLDRLQLPERDKPRLR